VRKEPGGGSDTGGVGSLARLYGRRLSRTLLAVALLTGVVASAPSAPAPAAAQTARPEPSTPELIEAARDRGEIDPGTADLYLARVLAGRGRSADVPSRFQSDRPWDGTLPIYGPVTSNGTHVVFDVAGWFAA
jgi:hypothetical protein